MCLLFSLTKYDEESDDLDDLIVEESTGDCVGQGDDDHSNCKVSLLWEWKEWLGKV